jgi:nucleoside-diphosphate-sugar epimerase
MSGVILLTGASSFTGLWIAEALAGAGYDVLAPLRGARDDYGGVRLERVRRLGAVAEVAFSCPVASPAMRELIGAQPRIDALAHHAAEIAGYRDPGFDASTAVARNLEGTLPFLRRLCERGAGVMLATATVFEAGEGGEGPSAPAVMPYGLSKTLTNTALDHYAAWAGLRFGKFVIPSPYGPFEEKRFGWHLFSNWFAGTVPVVRTPLYIRDHLPAPLLARAYAAHLTDLLIDPLSPGVRRPSGWIAPQGEFGRRVAAEAARRLGRDCPLEFNAQQSFEEPAVRVNSEPCAEIPWDEATFWDDYVDWYQALYDQGAFG